MPPPVKDTIKVKAIIDFPQYEKLQQYLGCKNSDLQLVCITENGNSANNVEKNVATHIFDKSFNVAGNGNDEQQKELPKLDAVTIPDEPEKSDDHEKQFRSLTSYVPPSYKNKAEKLFAALGLDSYDGGAFALDNQTYDYAALTDIINRLYGKKRAHSAKTVTSDSRSESFINSITSRRGLKRLVKNKKVFRSKNNITDNVAVQKKDGRKQEDWWKFL